MCIAAPEFRRGFCGWGRNWLQKEVSYSNIEREKQEKARIFVYIAKIRQNRQKSACIFW